jgi:stress response protein SCP2
MDNDMFSGSPKTPPAQDDIKILSFDAEPYPDGRRVKVKLLLSSFLQGPNALINLSNQENQELATVNIVNIFSSENEITLHIPGNKKQPGKYTVDVEVFYVEEEEIERDGEQQIFFRQSLIDSASTSFSIQ